MSEKGADVEHVLCCVQGLRAALFNESPTEDRAILIATIFTMEANRIYETIGGKILAAAQFQAATDEVTGQAAGEDREVVGAV